MAASDGNSLADAMAMRAYVVSESAEGVPSGRMETVPLQRLPPGEVTIRVAYSSANYKDALAATGHRGVVRMLPHVPGIDAAGVVVESKSPQYAAGEKVLVTGYGLGADQWGGWAEFVRVPAEWTVPLPAGLTLREAMILGTAGFTAAQCVMAFEKHGIEPASGQVVVTGATGGVGSIAVALLSQLGYEVTAISGKADRAAWLRSLGAADVQPRSAVDDPSDRPLLSSRWAGAVDTVGGRTLATLVRSMRHRGCVTACGLVGGAELPLTVHPFILRGVKLDGIDSAQCPYPQRREIWNRFATTWKIAALGRLATELPLEDAATAVDALLSGKAVGRQVIRVSPESED